MILRAFGNLGYAAPATPRRRGNPESGNLGYAGRQHRRRDTPRLRQPRKRQPGLRRAVILRAGCRLPRLRRIRRANTGAVILRAFGNLGYAAPATPRRRGNPESGNLGYAGRILRANTGAVNTGAFGNLGYAAPDCFTATPKAATWATPRAANRCFAAAAMAAGIGDILHTLARIFNMPSPPPLR